MAGAWAERRVRFRPGLRRGYNDQALRGRRTGPGIGGECQSIGGAADNDRGVDAIGPEGGGAGDGDDGSATGHPPPPVVGRGQVKPNRASTHFEVCEGKRPRGSTTPQLYFAS